jgi:hypothetical protein
MAIVEAIEQTKREKDLHEVRSTSSLNHNINGFSGDSYNHSLRMAFEWMDGINGNSREDYTVELVCYYPQKHKMKAILVSYKTNKKKV